MSIPNKSALPHVLDWYEKEIVRHRRNIAEMQRRKATTKKLRNAQIVLEYLKDSCAFIQNHIKKEDKQ